MYDYFEKKRVITFHGTGILYFVLHILSCVNVFNSTLGSTFLTRNGDLVQYHDMWDFRLLNISSNYQND